MVAFVMLFAISGSAQNTKTRINAKLAKQATVSLEQARQTASNTAAGDIESEELEKEHGKLVYSFNIRNAKGTISEVQVDAKSGVVVSNEEETKADEEREKREDAKRAKSKKPDGKH
jgi:uncharacterized membrane protein YkoI